MHGFFSGLLSFDIGDVGALELPNVCLKIYPVSCPEYFEFKNKEVTKND